MLKHPHVAGTYKNINDVLVVPRGIADLVISTDDPCGNTQYLDLPAGSHVTAVLVDSNLVVAT